jgi:uncharacterized 2Fe-2S/4Fe-4S cluster protein (DUF4445 family)
LTIRNSLKEVNVVFEPIGLSVKVPSGQSIHRVALKAHVPIGGECGGRGRCGKCQVTVENRETVSSTTGIERELLTKGEIASGKRLACQTVIQDDLTVYIPPDVSGGSRRIQLESVDRAITPNPAIRKLALHLQRPDLSDLRSDIDRLVDEIDCAQNLELDLGLLEKIPGVLRESNWEVSAVLWNNKKVIAVEPGDTTSESYGLAVDIGSSKIVVQLIDLNTGETMATHGAENPQLMYGEDVVERVVVSEEKEMLKHLQKIVIQEINHLLEGIFEDTGVSPIHVYEAVVVGNTVMNHIFLGLSPRTIAFSPYTPVIATPYDARVADIGININQNGVIHVPANIAGFVGADATADVVASGIFETDELTLQLDIGTNTEVFLGNREGIVTCSCASGPAFEGAHITHGMKAVDGAIECIRIGHETAVEYDTIGDSSPIGLCGSAVVDLVAELFRHGIIDYKGKIGRDLENERIRIDNNLPEFVVAWQNETGAQKDIVLTQKDVNEIILAKAAIFTGCSILMKRMSVNREQIKAVVMGGAFGCYLTPRNTIAIGMIPDVDPEIISFRGNLALLGAKMLLVSAKFREMERECRSRIKYIELTNDPDFKSEYTNALFLPNRKPERFPSLSRQPIC